MNKNKNLIQFIKYNFHNEQNLLQRQRTKFYNYSLCQQNRLKHSEINFELTKNNVLTTEYMSKTIDCFQKSLSSLIMNKNIPDKYAAVLIPIISDSKGQLSLLFTRRSGLMRRHIRQISFPGGIKDSTDKCYEDCALRECEEEIGLVSSRIKIWGKGSLIRPPHTAAIMPIIGSIDELSINELKLNKAEVDEVILISINELCAPNTKKHTQFKTGYSAPVFVTNQGKIWGITGALTDRFLNCLLQQQNYNSKVDYIKPYKGHVT